MGQSSSNFGRMWGNIYGLEFYFRFYNSFPFEDIRAYTSS